MAHTTQRRYQIDFEKAEQSPSVFVTIPITSILSAYCVYYHIQDGIFNNKLSQHCIHHRYIKLFVYLDDKIQKKTQKQFDIPFWSIIPLFKDNTKENLENLQSSLNVYCNICINEQFSSQIQHIISQHQLNPMLTYVKKYIDKYYETEYKSQRKSTECLFSVKRHLNIAILIKSESQLTTLKINTTNVNKCCNKLMKNHINGYEIQAIVNWNSPNKNYQDLLSRIIDGCIVHNHYGLASFLPLEEDSMNYNDTQRENRVSNCLFLFTLLFRNHRHVYMIMKHSDLWQFLFNVFNVLMRHSVNVRYVDTKYIQLFAIFIRNTIYRWKYEHIQYMDNINIFETLCIVAKKTYTHIYRRSVKGRRNNILIYDLIREITQSFYLLSKDEVAYNKTKFNDHYIKKFKQTMMEHFQLPKSIKRKNKKKSLRVQICQTQLQRYQKDINEFIQSKSKQLNHLLFIKRIKNRKVIICRNNQCYRSNFNTPLSKFKLCADCKSVYYCSRECQKYDWNHFHRNHCSVLLSKHFCF